MHDLRAYTILYIVDWTVRTRGGKLLPLQKYFKTRPLLRNKQRNVWATMTIENVCSIKDVPFGMIYSLREKNAFFHVDGKWAQRPYNHLRTDMLDYEILELLLSGYTAKEIPAILNVSESRTRNRLSELRTLNNVSTTNSLLSLLSLIGILHNPT